MASLTAGNLYLDTSYLISLISSIGRDFRFINLKNVLDLLGIRLFIPKIVQDELCVHKTENLKESLILRDRSFRDLNRILASERFKIPSDYEELQKNVATITLSNIEKAGIRVFDIPSEHIRIKELIDLAIYKIKPFNKDGEGFKDAVIISSILEHCKEENGKEHFFLTYNQSDFNFDAETCRVLLKKGEVLPKIFFTPDKLIEYLSRYMDATKFKSIQRSGRLRIFLLSQRVSIERFIENQFDFFISSHGQEHPLFKSALDGLCGPLSEKRQVVKLVEISSPVDKELSGGGKIEVLFEATVNVALTVTTNSHLKPEFGGSPMTSTSNVYFEEKVALNAIISIDKSKADSEFSLLEIVKIVETGG